jgi:hypothetical protein
MDREQAAHLRGEEVAEDKILLDAKEGQVSAPGAADIEAYAAHVVPEMEAVEDAIDSSWQGYDPRKQKEEAPEPEPFRVEPMSADWMLEVWYLYRTAGNLATGKMLAAEMGPVGVNEALAAALYVEGTDGFRREIVLFAQARRGEHDPWSKWYGNWPDNQRLAEAIYESFRAALAQSLKIKPFRILTTAIYTRDHLEEADAANERDLVERNREWQRRRREELTKSATNAA